jgi:hypothetical protein
MPSTAANHLRWESQITSKPVAMSRFYQFAALILIRILAVGGDRELDRELEAKAPVLAD